jgi:DNA invertase Pin-like site-specific DNA recombinase
MQGQRIGYIRVSSASQNVDRQLDGVQLDMRYVDTISGKSTERPQLLIMLQYARSGDTVIVHALDRLARNLGDLRSLVKQLTDKGVTVQFLKENLIFSGNDSPMSMLLLNMLGCFAEFERTLILERQREGIAIAKAQGKYKGGQKKLNSAQILEIKSKINLGLSKSKLAREYKISRSLIYQLIRSARVEPPRIESAQDFA